MSDGNPTSEEHNVIEVSFRPAATLDEVNDRLRSLQADIEQRLGPAVQTALEGRAQLLQVTAAVLAELEQRIEALEDRVNRLGPKTDKPLDS